MNKKVLGGAVAAVIGMIGVLAYAQAVPSGGIPPRYLPYVGHLDHDGSPVTGQVAMKVCLVTKVDTACDAGNVWFEQFDSVDVAGGNFSLTLGKTKAIPDGTFNAASLYIRAMVGATAAQGTPTFVQLSGAQQVLSVPYAININQASDLRLNGPLHNASAVPNSKNLGMYSQTAGDYMRFVSNAGSITFDLDNNYDYDPVTAGHMMSVQATGVAVGDRSWPIRQITVCRDKGTNYIAGPNRFVGFDDAHCTAGVPKGTCFGALAKTQDCGGGAAWTVYNPGEDARVPNGGVLWYNEQNCGPAHDVEAIFFCRY